MKKFEKFDEKTFTVTTTWVQENDAEIYDELHEKMIGFVEDESNQTFEKDLEAFESGDWLVEYSFFEEDGKITIRVYAGETAAAIANQPPWVDETIAVSKFKENYPFQKYIERLED